MCSAVTEVIPSKKHWFNSYALFSIACW